MSAAFASFAVFAALVAGTASAVSVSTDPLWDDGRAELSEYVGTTERYGERRPTRARIVVVKEDLLRSSLVKSESGPVPGRTVEVLKLNFIADFPTGTYAYHQTATVMLERATLRALKESMSHTEACGITYVRVGPKDGRWIHEAHSYWEGEADRQVPILWPRGEVLWWDALPVSLRPDVARAPFERRVWVLPSQVSGHSPIANARVVSGTLRMSEAGTIEVPAGRFAARRFELTTPAGTDRLWFAETFPHVLLRLESAAGRRLELRKTQRLDYWRHHAVGDERLVE